MSVLYKKTKAGHKALKRLRFLCGMTAENFSKLTGIGYGQLVAVEQGRRNLSAADAMQISANTGVDPAFNANKSALGIKSLWGGPYNESSLKYWQEHFIPTLRGGMARLQEGGQKDTFSEVICDNAAEILAASQVKGQELAVALALLQSLKDICERFGLGHSLVEWKDFRITFDDPRPPTAKGRQAVKGATFAQTIRCRVTTTAGQGVGRIDKKRQQREVLERIKKGRRKA